MNIFRVIPVDEPSPKSLKNVFSEIFPSNHTNYELTVIRIRFGVYAHLLLGTLHLFSLSIQLNTTIINWEILKDASKLLANKSIRQLTGK